MSTPFSAALRPLLVRSALLLALALPTLAQDDSDATLDSAMRRRNDLFIDVDPGVDTLDEETPRDTSRWDRWDPEFSPRFTRADLLGLHDRPVWFAYNRADGLYLGIGANLPARAFRERRLRGHLAFGYGFGSHYWQVSGGISRDVFSETAPLRLSAEGHIITDTKDAWKMPSGENTAFALLAGIDTRDYFQRRGFSVSAEQFLTPRTSVAFEYLHDSYRNSRREIGWSLFGPKQPFFEVPPITEGPMRSGAVRLVADYMTLRSWSDPQLAVAARFEFGSGEDRNVVDTVTGVAKPYDFQQLVVDARVKTTIISRLLFAAVRVRAGSATGEAPRQKLFTIGGFGSLPGFRQNEFEGSRMLLVQTDLLFQISTSKPFSNLRLILSNDFGGVGTPEPGKPDGLLDAMPTSIEDLRYSIGAYLGSPAGRFRIGVAWRTDRMEAPTFVIRLSERF